MRLPSLTLFGRSVLLMVCEITANAICWIVAGILFGRNSDTRPVLSMALLAWIIIFACERPWDYDTPWMPIISGKIQFDYKQNAIDNATRGLINLGQISVTCGLFFSLGHSTIVVIVNVAIAISADVYTKLHGVGEVGGIVGAAVSGSFLFIVGLANTVILWKIVKRRQMNKAIEKRRREGEVVEEINYDPKREHMLMMRILGPIITFVNRPWKMYPVGILFGFGFDTASSIALIAVSALAKRDSDGSSISSGHIIILPLLFTAGMTLVDSADSILMLYSYSGFPDRSLIIFAKDSREDPRLVSKNNSQPTEKDLPPGQGGTPCIPKPSSPISHNMEANKDLAKSKGQDIHTTAVEGSDNMGSVLDQDTRVKMNVMSGLSIILTLMSILVAFSISLITIMGLIGEQCGPCTAAAEADDGHGGGLAGSWWRGWAEANDKSGFIGIAIVGGFLLIVTGWYGSQWVVRRVKRIKDGAAHLGE